jgi:hypothetical protein
MHGADHEVSVENESDQIQEGDQEHQIDSQAIDRDQDTSGRTDGWLRRTPLAGGHTKIVLRICAEIQRRGESGA